MGDIEGEEVGKISQLLGQASGQFVERQVYIFKVGEVCNGSRN